MPFASALAKMPSGLALPLALLFLTPALVLLTLPVFSAPFTARLAWFGWTYPASYDVQGFNFGIWGGCRLADTPALRGCTYKTWGYNLNMADLALATSPGIRGRFTRALGVLLPLAAILTLIAFVLVILSALRAHTLSRRRSLPQSHASVPTKPKMQIVGALVTGLAFASGLVAVVLGYFAYNSAVVNINRDTGMNMAGFRNCFYMCIAAVPLLLFALAAQVVAIVRYCRFQAELRRRVDDKQPGGGMHRGHSFDSFKAPQLDRKWTEFHDED